MPKLKEVACKRPYNLGRRLELSDHKRAAILAAARTQLESNGFLRLTMDSLAAESGITRQTVHNLFGTKAGVIEALFDQIAMDAGMQRMRGVMQQADPESMLADFVRIFTDFWAKDRMLLRRVRGIAAIDPEFGAAVEARNRRRLSAATRVVEHMDRKSAAGVSRDRAERIAALYAMTSFEFFDALAESCGSEKDSAELVLSLAKKTMAATR